MNKSETHENRVWCWADDNCHIKIHWVNGAHDTKRKRTNMKKKKKKSKFKPNGWRLGTLLRHIYSTASGRASKHPTWKSDCVHAVARLMHSRRGHKRWAPSHYYYYYFSYYYDANKWWIETIADNNRIIFLPANPLSLHQQKAKRKRSSFRVEATTTEVWINCGQSNLHHLQSNKFHLFVLPNSMNEWNCLFIYFIFFMCEMWTRDGETACERQWMRKTFGNAVI